MSIKLRSITLLLCLVLLTFLCVVKGEVDDSYALVETETTAAATEFITPEYTDSALIELSKSTKRGKSSKSRSSKRGWGISSKKPRRVQQRLPGARLTGAAASLTRANVRCVLCQFITQKIKNQLTATSEDGAPSASLIEAFAFASAGDQSRIESTVEAAADMDAKANALPAIFDHGSDAPRRFRQTDLIGQRPGFARFTQVRAGAQTPDETRAAYRKLYASVYGSFEGLCAKRMPLAYLPYCNDMLKSYRFFAQGINYGDRPDQICMNGNFCDHRAYVRRDTHRAYIREPGDA